jgi:hypothetical protein
VKWFGGGVAIFVILLNHQPTKPPPPSSSQSPIPSPQSSSPINITNSIMQNFPFGELLKKAWKNTFFNMKLWWLGLFAGGSAFSSMNLDPQTFGKDGDKIVSSLQSIPSGIWIAIGIAVVILGLLMMFVTIVSQIGLVRGVDLGLKGEKSNLWPLIKFGVKKLPRYLLFTLLIFVIVAPLIALLILSIWMKSILLMILGIFLIFIVCIGMGLFLFYSIYYILLCDEKVISAMSKSVDLFKKNWAVTVITIMIIWGVTMTYMFALVIAMFILVLPGALLFAGVSMLSPILAIILGAIGGIIIFVLYAAASAGYATFLYSFYVAVFNKLEGRK